MDMADPLPVTEDMASMSMIISFSTRSLQGKRCRARLPYLIYYVPDWSRPITINL